jgi:3'-phosphoadenosine 5'-phosphosulfate sulfotransferase (PAPS reductase)/FAD synthetase
MSRVLVWFSDGAASAVAAHLAIQKYRGRVPVEVVKCDTTVSEHPDNERFRRDVELWIGQRVILLRSDTYADIDDVFARTRYMAGNAGARCTTELKKLVRQRYEQPDDIHVFGYTADETPRVLAFEANNPELLCDWVLVQQVIGKAECYQILQDAGIALPAMYAAGFEHNNCLGCVKASSPAYWNRTRRLFPDVFARRAVQSRDLGARLVRVASERIFLDELDPHAGAGESDGDIECGPFCVVPEQASLNWFGVVRVPGPQ